MAANFLGTDVNTMNTIVNSVSDLQKEISKAITPPEEPKIIKLKPKPKYKPKPEPKIIKKHTVSKPKV